MESNLPVFPALFEDKLNRCRLAVVLLVLRYAFLFDKAMFVCKKKGGETFELKELIELQNYQIRDETSGEKDNKKVFQHRLCFVAAPAICRS